MKNGKFGLLLHLLLHPEKKSTVKKFSGNYKKLKQIEEG